MAKKRWVEEGSNRKLRPVGHQFSFAAKNSTLGPAVTIKYYLVRTHITYYSKHLLVAVLGIN